MVLACRRWQQQALGPQRHPRASPTTSRWRAPPGTEVPVIAQGEAVAQTAPGDLGDIAVATVSLPDMHLATIASSADGAGSGSVLLDQQMEVLSGSPIEVLLTAGANGFTTGARATALADPFFEIAPNFAAINPGLRLVFSDGIGNNPLPLPEPSTWTLLLAGLCCMGCALRGRPRAAKLEL